MCLNGMYMESFTLCFWFVSYSVSEPTKSRGCVQTFKKKLKKPSRDVFQCEKQIAARITVGRAP